MDLDTRETPYRTLSATLAYDGRPFCGFARQEGLLTVQGQLEEALSILFRHPVETVCAGRTDAGVHARGQVVSFNLSEEDLAGRELHRIRTSLNALTDETIRVKEVEMRPTGFSARFDAKLREYRYFITGGDTPPLFSAPYSWYVRRPIDEEALAQAAGYLVGEHDFKSFCVTASAIGKSTTREVFSIDFFHEENFGERALVMRVKGNAFLHSMIRTMVGTLMEVGVGHKDPAWVQDVLKAQNRAAAGQTAPASGLVFWSVVY